ncbi:MAG: hypothetical protein DSY42_09775 [Aquifex sp.]|nr:MAG: hypothetical protein DSY42_09775 [Aquifex sp.]
MNHKEKLKYILVSFILGFSIWFAVNFGERLPLDITRFVEIKGKNPNYAYEINPPFVDITLLVSRKLLQSKLLEKVKVYIEVDNLKEGEYKIRVITKTPIPVLIQPVAVNPYHVKVRIKKVLK